VVALAGYIRLANDPGLQQGSEVVVQSVDSGTVITFDQGVASSPRGLTTGPHTRIVCPMPAAPVSR
jgi:hypothetical protein